MRMERTLYGEEGLALTEKDGELFLRIGEESCLLACHPYEPCTRLYRGESLCAAVHNAFTAEEIRALAKGGTARAVTGSEYDVGRLCRLLAQGCICSCPRSPLSRIPGRKACCCPAGRSALLLLRGTGVRNPTASEPRVPCEQEG